MLLHRLNLPRGKNLTLEDFDPRGKTSIFFEEGFKKTQSFFETYLAFSFVILAWRELLLRFLAFRLNLKILYQNFHFHSVLYK